MVRVNELNATSFEFLALNESVTSVVVQTVQNTTQYSVSPTTEWTTLDHNMDSETYLIIDFYNAGGDHVHRWSRFVLSGLSVNTAIDGGMNQIALINDARISRDPQPHGPSKRLQNCVLIRWSMAPQDSQLFSQTSVWAMR